MSVLVLRYYRTALGESYDGYCEHHCHPLGLMSKYILYALLTAILSLGLRVVIAVVGLWDGGEVMVGGWALHYLVHAILNIKAFVFVFVLMRKSAVAAFLGGSVLSSSLM